MSVAQGRGDGSAVMASRLSTERTMTMLPKCRLPSTMPVPLSSSRTAKAWKGLWAATSSSTMTVAARTRSTRSGVTSPMMRVARAGPGKGMRL